MARILVTGGGGMLAQAVHHVLASRHSVRAIPREELDITDATRVRESITREKPHVLVNCAAFTRVDDCEREEERANRVNGIAVGYLAAALPATSLLVHVSTDFVFDGSLGRPYREEDPVRPLSAYGRSKLLGERAVQSRRGPWLMVRTAWLFGKGGPNFVKAISEKIDRQESLRIVDDQRGSPTWSIDLAGALLHLVDGGYTGTFHAAGAGEPTWHDFAVEIARALGSTVEVAAIPSSELGRPARRPADSRLDTSKLAQCGYRMLEWKEALRRHLGQERSGWKPRGSGS